MANKLKRGLPVKVLNISQLAELLGVHRHTVRYWIKKGWVSVKRDYRNQPVFTSQDVESIRKWRRTLRAES